MPSLAKPSVGGSSLAPIGRGPLGGSKPSIGGNSNVFGTKEKPESQATFDQYSGNFGKPSAGLNNSVSSGIPKNETPKKDLDQVLGSKPNMLGAKKMNEKQSIGEFSGLNDKSGS